MKLTMDCLNNRANQSFVGLMLQNATGFVVRILKNVLQPLDIVCMNGVRCNVNVIESEEEKLRCRLDFEGVRIFRSYQKHVIRLVMKFLLIDVLNPGAGNDKYQFKVKLLTLFLGCGIIKCSKFNLKWFGKNAFGFSLLHVSIGCFLLTE